MTLSCIYERDGEARRDAIGSLVSRYPAISRKEHEQLVRLLEAEATYHRARTERRAPPPRDHDNGRDGGASEPKEPVSLKLVVLIIAFVLLLTVLRALSHTG